MAFADIFPTARQRGMARAKNSTAEVVPPVVHSDSFPASRQGHVTHVQPTRPTYSEDIPDVSHLKSIAECNQATAEAIAEGHRILWESTEAQLARNQYYQSRILERTRELSRQKKQVQYQSADKKSQLERDAEAELRTTHTLEQSAIAELPGSLLPQRYIRADAVEFYSKAHLDARQKADAAVKAIRANSSVAEPGPRIKQMIHDADELAVAWRSEEKICRVGQRVHELRERRRQLQLQIDTMRETREAAALKAAGFDE